MNVDNSSNRYQRTASISAIDVEAFYGAIAAQDSLYSPHARLVFEVVEKIGEGGMGAVYKVRDKRLGRLAALKMLSNDDGCKESQKRFLREAKITARLEHPAIPSVFEAGRSAGGELYLLMRLIEGQTLSQRIDAMHDNDCPRSEVLELIGALAKVGEAVAYAHSQGVVHRDLKPDNIMIGAFGEVLVIDWGIAKDSEETELEALNLLSTMKGSKLLAELPKELTTAGAFLGTPGYAAPEQINSDDCDGRADIFALGIILIEILTGQSAIPGDSGAAKLIALSSGEIDMPRTVDSSLPKELDWIAFQATALDPDDRTETAEEFVSQLKSWLAGEPVEGYQYGFNERAIRVVKRRPSLMIGVVMTSLLLAMTGVLSSALNEAERKSEQLDVAQLQEQKAKSEAATAKLAAERLNEAQDLVRRGGKLQTIIEKIEDGLKLSNRAYPQLLRAAKLYEDAKAPKQQRSLLEEAVESHPPAYEALYALHVLELNATNLTFHFTEPLHLLTKRAQERGDENEFTLFFEGNKAHGENQLKKALALFNKAEAITNKFAWLYVNRGLIHQSFGDRKRALADFNRAIELNPQLAVAYCNRGAFYNESKDYKQALANFKKSVQINPRFAVGHFNCAVARVVLGDNKGALTDYSNAISADPNYADAYYSRGLLYNKLGDKRRALNDMTRVIELNPKPAMAYNQRGGLRHHLGDSRGALADYNKAAELDPNNAMLFYHRGIVRDSLKDKKGAIADFSRAIELNPRLENAFLNRAALRFEAGQIAASQDDYDQLLKLNPKDARAYRGRGAARYLRQDKRGSMEDFSRSIELDPQEFSAYVDRGNARGDLGDNKGAIADYSKAIELKSDSAKIYFLRAKILAKMGDSKGAADDCRAAVELNPKLYEAHNFRGHLLYVLGDKIGARDSFSRVIELNPNSAIGYNNRGNIRLLLGENEAAISDFSRVIELNPQHGDAFRNRGTIRHYTGKSKEAIDDVNQAIRINPKDSKAFFIRGVARAALNENAAALQDLLHYLKLTPKDSAVDRANKKIVELKAKLGLK